METTQKTHYKRLMNLDYIGAYSLEDGKDLTVTITAVSRKTVVGEGGKKDECIVAALSGGQKPMILNSTNCKTLTAIYKSPFIEDWVGKPIALFVTTTRMGGETVECLRIRSTAQSLPQLTPASPKWSGAVEALSTSKCKMEDIKAKYTISTENEAKLNQESAV